MVTIFRLQVAAPIILAMMEYHGKTDLAKHGSPVVWHMYIASVSSLGMKVVRNCMMANILAFLDYIME